MNVGWFAAASILWLAAATAALPAQPQYAWTLPAGFPPPMVPADNPMTDAKVELGRHLFYDTRLSANGTQSCSTCHLQSQAFTESRATSVGSTGEVHPRSSMSLVNVAYAQALTWGDRTQTKLEEQAMVPIYGEQPIELGLNRSDTWITILMGDARYQQLFAVEFHNTGLYNLAARFSYPAQNTGLFEITKQPEDVGKFKVPTLRNVGVTAPYMHDGSVRTLEDAIDHYAAGGRTITTGPYQGVGHDNPNKTASIRGFTLTPAQRDDLVAFLKSLTDEPLLTDPRFANPWPSAGRR